MDLVIVALKFANEKCLAAATINSRRSFPVTSGGDTVLVQNNSGRFLFWGEENEKVVIGEYSRFHDFDYEVLKRKVELYRTRISELAAL